MELETIDSIEVEIVPMDQANTTTIQASGVHVFHHDDCNKNACLGDQYCRTTDERKDEPKPTTDGNQPATGSGIDEFGANCLDQFGDGQQIRASDIEDDMEGLVGADEDGKDENSAVRTEATGTGDAQAPSVSEIHDQFMDESTESDASDKDVNSTDETSILDGFGHGSSLHVSDIRGKPAGKQNGLADDSSASSPVLNARNARMTSTPMASSSAPSSGGVANLFNRKRINKLKGKKPKATFPASQNNSNVSSTYDTNFTKQNETDLAKMLKSITDLTERLAKLDSMRDETESGTKHDALTSFTLKTLIEMGDPDRRMTLSPNPNTRGAPHWQYFKLSKLDGITTPFAVCTHCLDAKTEMLEACVCKLNQGGGNFVRHHGVIKRRAVEDVSADDALDQEGGVTRSTRMKSKPLKFDVHPLNKNDKSINMKYFSCTKNLSKRHRAKLIQACLDFVTLDVRPFRACTGTGFMRYSQALIDMTLECGKWNAESSLPHHSTLSKHCKFRAIKTSELLKALLKKVDAVNVIADHWQEIRNGYMFIGVAVCFCFPNTTHMMCPTIGVFQVDHEDAETTKSELMKIYMAYGISDKILYAVSDAGGGLRLALQQMHPNRWGHCSGHLSNICLKNTIFKCFQPKSPTSELAEDNTTSKKPRSDNGGPSSQNVPSSQNWAYSHNGSSSASQSTNRTQQLSNAYGTTIMDNSDGFPKYYGTVMDLPPSNNSDEEAEEDLGEDANLLLLDEPQHIAGKRRRPDLAPIQEEYNDWLKLSREITICKELVTKVKSKKLQAEFEPSLKQAIETRWDSTHTNVHSVVKNESRLLKCSDNDVLALASSLDFELLRNLECYLGAYKEEREKLAFEHKPTLSRVITMKKIYINTAKSADYLLSSATRKRYADYIQENFGIYRLHVVAAYLDPVVFFGHARSDLDNHFKAESKTLEYGSASLIVQEELQYVVDLLNKPTARASAMAPTNNNTSASDSLLKLLGKRDYDMLILNNEEVQNNLNSLDNQSNGTYDALLKEMRNYEDKKNIGLNYIQDAATDLLDFWKKRRGCYPILYKCALAVLSCPSSQNKVERLFSICMRTCSHLRVNMLADTISSLMMSHSVVVLENQLDELNLSIENALGEEGMKELMKKQQEVKRITGVTNDEGDDNNVTA